jgi:glycosyltransferase involved in cell wall biosynthesis
MDSLAETPAAAATNNRAANAKSPMKILLHDFAGHAFPAELSRELARRGHAITHAYCGTVAAGRGDVSWHRGDPPTLRFVDASVGDFERYRPLRRLVDEARYGRSVAKLVRSSEAEAVLSANAPLFAQAFIWRASRRSGALRLYWLQDLLGSGTRRIMRSRSSRLGGSLVGRLMEALETRLLARSDAIIAIADDFVDQLAARAIEVRTIVLENWAPTAEVMPRPKDNPISRKLGVARLPVALYAGTLGLKHDPGLLVLLAQRLAQIDATVVVATEGIGRAALEAAKEELGLANLMLIDYLPYEDLSDLLGSADVCVAVLEPDAGSFSVPSKVLTYLAAARPIVAVMPADNLASRIVHGSGAGVVVAPGDNETFLDAVESLLRDEASAARRGAAGRKYAEERFSVQRAATAVEELL